MTNYINGHWLEGHGPDLVSHDPATSQHLWNGKSASPQQVEQAFEAARDAFAKWSGKTLNQRLRIVRRFRDLAKAIEPDLGALIARETGKALWDAMGEAGVVWKKVDVSITAYRERTGKKSREMGFGKAVLQHRPHGVLAVLGPYNFPAHLPNGHIIPALIAGNTVVFKPSEHCPAVAETLVRLYADAGFPPGVVNMVQGARDVGSAVLSNPHLDGVLFTGSARTGAMIHKQFGGRPEVVLALEMGGNNPLIVWDAKDVKAAASLVVQSAFITSGQRCTCARRLIVPDNDYGKQIVEEVLKQTEQLTLGSWRDGVDVSLGSLISADVAAQVVDAAKALLDHGARIIRTARISPKDDTAFGGAFVEPGIYDVTGCDVPDEEIFGPVLQVIRVKDWDYAINVANSTKFGLAAGLISDKHKLWDDFCARIRAGIVNFNRPTTGAAGFLPFGGLGASGNHNPAAYYAADFCAWPMASQVAEAVEYNPMIGIAK